MVVAVRRRRWPFVLGTIAALLVILVLVWDWNWFTPLVERIASAKLRRTVKIGHMDLHLSRQPTLVLDRLSISDPPDDPAHGDLATVRQFDLQVDALAMLRGRYVIPEIRFDHPVMELHSYGNQQTNYAFTSGGSSTNTPSPPRVGSLIVDDGRIHFNDPALKSDVKITVDTPVEHGLRMLQIGADGTYSGQPITGRFTGGSVLSIQDAQHPYPIDLDVRNGDNHVAAKGTVKDPMHFGGADVTLLVEGDDLSKLYPLTGIPIPPTPKYRLTGALDAAGQDIRFSNFAGTVGESDLEGNITVTPGKERPFVTADMQSRRVVLADLAGFVGNTPGGESAAASTPQQREDKARQEANGPLLPTTPINLPKLRAADLEVHYVGKHIDSKTTPLDDLDLRLTVQDGTIRLEPLKFGMGQGVIALNLALNGQQDEVHAKGNLTVEHVDLKRIMEDLKPFKGSGIISGRADIDTVGNSPAAMLGNGNGTAALTMSGGNLSALLQDLGGLEVGRAIYRYLAAQEQTPVRCMVADVALKQGIMSTKTFVLDTGEENLYLSGTMNLKSQTMDMKLTSEAKHFSILSVKAPIDITGSLKSPAVAPDMTDLAKRGGAAALLSTVLTPIAGILATIQLGDDQQSDCKDLLAKVNTHDASPNKGTVPAMPSATDARARAHGSTYR